MCEIIVCAAPVTSLRAAEGEQQFGGYYSLLSLIMILRHFTDAGNSTNVVSIYSGFQFIAQLHQESRPITIHNK